MSLGYRWNCHRSLRTWSLSITRPCLPTNAGKAYFGLLAAAHHYIISLRSLFHESMEYSRCSSVDNRLFELLIRYHCWSTVKKPCFGLIQVVCIWCHNFFECKNKTCSWFYSTVFQEFSCWSPTTYFPFPHRVLWFFYPLHRTNLIFWFSDRVYWWIFLESVYLSWYRSFQIKVSSSYRLSLSFSWWLHPRRMTKSFDWDQAEISDDTDAGIGFSSCHPWEQRYWPIFSGIFDIIKQACYLHQRSMFLLFFFWHWHFYV